MNEFCNFLQFPKNRHIYKTFSRNALSYNRDVNGEFVLILKCSFSPYFKTLVESFFSNSGQDCSVSGLAVENAILVD